MSMKTTTRISTTLTVLSAAVLTGCAGIPKRTEAPALQSITNYATQQSFDASRGQWPTDAWWRSYGDAQLSALIDEGLAASPPLAIADARLRRARALTQSKEAALLPNVAGAATVNQQKQSYNYLSPAEVTPQGWNEYGQAALDLSWELDFWGRNRAALAAATSEMQATMADAAQARLVLSTSIASSYADLVREFAVRDTAVAARGVRGTTVELFQRRYEQGLETLASVRQVEARLATAEAEVLAIEEQIALTRNRLAALVGAGPDRGLAIDRPALDVGHVFGLPDQLEADLIGRRPDLVAARLRATAAARRIDHACAGFYPNVNLSAVIGVQALGLDVLSKDGSSMGHVGPAITLPMFDGGRLRANLRGAEAEYAEAVASYNNTVVQALREIADVAVSHQALAPQVATVAVAVGAAREAWRVQNLRYEGGLATYLEVLSAEDYLLANLRTQAELQARSLTLDVALVRALGGGYEL
jgi:NodT family efflux transporter outer membrane factor (OMF) lipoprotein